jgi:ABC-type uncharacterized transport system permease subunit
MTPFFFIVAALYGAATVLYFVYLFGRNEATLRVARWTLAGALAAHLAMIGLLCTQKLSPLRDLRGALSLTAWLLGVGYLATTFRTRMGPVGAFIAPLALALLVSARFTPQTASAGGTASTSLGKLHIALVAMGVAAFGLAAAVALIYLLQEAALKRKRIGPLFRRSPPLSALDDAGRMLILVGFPLYTLAVVTGVIWVARLPGHGAFRVEYLIAGITWVIFGLLILARWTVGWRGRQAALATLFGFVATMVVLVIYIGRRMLGG